MEAALLGEVDELLNLIEDGTWHTLKRLSKKLHITREKVVTLSKLLSETSIVEYKDKEGKVRLKHEWRQILQGMDKKRGDGKAAVGTIVLPPKKSLRIQGIQVTNLTEEELELDVRLINEKIEELAISTLKTTTQT